MAAIIIIIIIAAGETSKKLGGEHNYGLSQMCRYHPLSTCNTTYLLYMHIGHSFLTHSFLLKGEEPPMCIGCDKRHVFNHRAYFTCSDFIEIRESHFTAKSLRMLFKDISPEKIFNFLKEINIFWKI